MRIQHRITFALGLLLCIVSVYLAHKCKLPDDYSRQGTNKPYLVIQDGHTNDLTALCFSHDGKFITSGDADGVIKIWESSTLRLLRTFKGNSKSIVAVVSHPNRYEVLSISTDNTIKCFDIGTGQLLRTVRSDSSKITSIAFSPNGKRIAAGINTDENDHKKYSIGLWEADTGQFLKTLGSYSDHIGFISFSLDGRYLVTVSKSAIELWDIETSQSIQSLVPHENLIPSPETLEEFTMKSFDRHIFTKFGPLNSIAFSPVEKQFVTVNGYINPKVEESKQYSINLWDVNTGNWVRGFRGVHDLVCAVIFNPDGKHIIAVRTDTIEILDMENIKFIKKAFTGDSPFAVSPDGRTLISKFGENSIKVTPIELDEPPQMIDGKSTLAITSVAISPDGRYIASGIGDKGSARGSSYSVLRQDDNTVKLWDIKTGQLIRSLKGHTYDIFSIAYSQDGKYIVSGGQDGRIILWRVDTGQLVQTIKTEGSIFSVAISSNNQYIASGKGNSILELWKMATGKLVKTIEPQLKEYSATIWSLAFSPDSRAVAAGVYLRDDGSSSRSPAIILWNIHTGRPIWIYRFDTSRGAEVLSIFFSQDGKFIVAGGEFKYFSLIDAKTGKLIRNFKGHTNMVNGITISPDGRYIASASADDTVKIWDLSTGRFIQALDRHSAQVEAVAFSPDGSFLVSGGRDRTVRIWSLQSDKLDSTETITAHERCILTAFADSSWAVIDPDGRFDAANGGDITGLHWVMHNEPIALNQLKERYYEPGLLAKLMGFNKEPLLDVKPFTAEELYPEVALSAPQPNDSHLNIHLINRGGGIGRVIVSINGKEISSDARRADANPNTKELQLAVPITDHPYLIPGKENVIEVKAFNAEGYLSSRNVRVVYQPSVKIKIESPHLWAIVVGVSDYRGQNIDLRYAAKDAMDVSHALQIGAQRLFGVDRLHLKLLTTAANGGATLPTKANLLQAFQDAAKTAKSTDILVVYLAGHGINYGTGQEGDYYYLLNEARSGDLNDPEVRKLAALSSAELTELIKQVPALKQVLILDTCASGRLVEKLTEKRDISSSQIRALERMKDRTGMHILAGSAADAVSYETSRYGQGLLTYSLLLGMRGAALRDDEFIDISNLFQFSADQVPDLAKDIGGIQRPLVAAPRGGTSFDIGRVTREDKMQIQIATPRPLVLRANFQDEDRFIDRLGLTVRVNNALREISSRGPSASLIFIDASEFPAAYSLAGRYRTIAGKLQVTVRLFRGEQKVGEFIVTGVPTAFERLTEDILQETEKQIALLKP